MAKIFDSDITPCKQGNEALTASETRYRRLFESAKDGILILDADTGMIVDVNPFLIDLLNSSRDKFLGKKVWELGFFKDIIATQMHFAELQSRGYVRYEDVPLETTDGRRVDVEFVSNVYEEGHQNVIQCNIRDITKRKLTEETLRKTSTLLQSTFAAMQDLVTVHDKRLHVVLSNWHGEEDITEEERSSKPHCYSCYMHRDKPCDPCPTLEVFRTGRAVDMEIANPYTGRTLEVSAYPIPGASGNVELVTEHVKDITERKQAEEALHQSEVKYKAIFQATGTATLIVESDATIVLANDNCLAVTGYSPEELIGAKWSDYVAPESLEIMLKYHLLRREESSNAPHMYEAKLVKKDGGIRTAILNINMIPATKRSVVSILDITDRKQAEEALCLKTTFLEAQLNSSIDGILVVDSQGRPLSENKRSQELWGIPPEIIAQNDPLTRMPFVMQKAKNPEQFREKVQYLLAHPDETLQDELEFKDGTILERYSSPVLGIDGTNYGRIWTFHDITERKQAEEALKQSQEQYRILVDNANEAIVVAQDGHIVFANRTAFELFPGYSEQELAGKLFTDFVHPDDHARMLENLRKRLNSESISPINHYRLIMHDGEVKWVEIGTALIEWKGKPATLNFITDITERKQAEEALKESEEKFRNLADQSPNIIFIHSGKNIVYVNEKAIQMMGYSKEEFYSPKFNFLSLIAPEFQEQMKSSFTAHRKGKDVPVIENCIITKAGTRIEVILSTKLIDYGKKRAILGTITDISERKAMEDKLHTIFSHQKTVLSVIPDIIMEVNMNKTYTWANSAGISFFGEDVLGKEAAYYFEGEQETYKAVQPVFDGKEETIYVESWQRRKDGEKRLLAWRSQPLKDANGRVAGALSVAHDITERKKAEEALAASEKRNTTIIESANEGILISDIETKRVKYANPAMCRMLGYNQEELREMSVDDLHPKDSLKHLVPVFETQAKGTKIFTEGLPFMRKDGAILYTDAQGAQALVDETMCSIGFITDASERISAEEERKQNTKKRIKAMDDTIKVLAMTVEVKDPYTAGHQHKVSSLAESIATEMGLPEERAEGIRIAGIVHDIGKMYIPSEILSKPGHLSEIELSMIKTHPQAAYDILQLIDFPWPVAQAVLQHHERMDGSGYPGHLSGKDIILEAKILAVADVVEAMASHRPYRPALGIDKALREISHNKGILYDSEVVDVCLRLFNEKGFEFG